MYLYTVKRVHHLGVFFSSKYLKWTINWRFHIQNHYDQNECFMLFIYYISFVIEQTMTLHPGHFNYTTDFIKVVWDNCQYQCGWCNITPVLNFKISQYCRYGKHYGVFSLTIITVGLFSVYMYLTTLWTFWYLSLIMMLINKVFLII